MTEEQPSFKRLLGGAALLLLTGVLVVIALAGGYENGFEHQGVRLWFAFALLSLPFTVSALLAGQLLPWAPTYHPWGRTLLLLAVVVILCTTTMWSGIWYLIDGISGDKSPELFPAAVASYIAAVLVASKI